ncbi:MAG: MCP four helix bundle domain-containing protein [Candidatus Omnitrophica bacterium]|nr:MCP four helix bundle domain-containing protein [Candidatus Omnitrophota bacterium]
MKVAFSHRIIGGLAVMAFLLILVGYFTFITTKNLQNVSRSIMKENVSSLKAAEELELALLNQKGMVSSYILDGNPEWLRTLEEKKRDFDIWFKNAQEVALTPEEKRILQDIRALYKVYDNQRNRAIGLYQGGNVTEAKGILLNDMKNSIDALYQKCEDLILTNESLIVKAEASSRRNAIKMTSLIWVTILITLCLGLVMGFLIARKVGEQLVQSAKMASLGQLSATIAHEIRNPLSAIKMRVHSLQEELKENLSAKDDTAVINEEINRMEKIVQNFLDFARPPEPNLQRVDIHRVLESTVDFLSPKVSSQKIEIHKRWEAVSLEVEIDKEQMRQAFLNILLNAIEAMPHGGRLEISTSMKNGDRKSAGVLDIEFKDTGVGIPPDLKKKLFEPFFTTKQTGIGLGLFIASRIIQMHKGVITINSEAGGGTRLNMRLPIPLKDSGTLA